MRIGIISKEAHAKAVVKALTEDGHEIVMLGANPTSIPSNIEVIVCRTVSSSSRAADLAFHAKREGRTVVFDNGSTRVREDVARLAGPTTMAQAIVKAGVKPGVKPAVKATPPIVVRRPLAAAVLPPEAGQDLEPPATPAPVPAQPAPVPVPAPAPAAPPPTPDLGLSIREMIIELHRHLGWFSSRIAAGRASKITGKTPGGYVAEAIVACLVARGHRSVHSVTVKMFGTGRNPEPPYKAVTIYHNADDTSYPTFLFYVGEAPNLTLAAEQLGCTVQPLHKLTTLPTGGKAAPTVETPAAPPVETPAAPAAPAPAPAPAPASVPSPPSVVKSTPLTGDMREDLKTLEGLCREYMDRHQLTEWHVVPGKTQFRRIVVEEGTLD